MGRRARAWVVALSFLSLEAATAADAAEVRDVRIGRHPTFTRVVFELDRPTGYRIERNEASGISEIVVSLRAGAQAEKVKAPKSLIEALEIESLGKTAVARIRLAKPELTLKEMILANPPRIVLDVSSSESQVAAAAKPKATKAKPKVTAKATPKPKVTAKATPAKPTKAAAKPTAEKPKVTAKATPTAKPAVEKPAVAKLDPSTQKGSDGGVWLPTPSAKTDPSDGVAALEAEEALKEPVEKRLTDAELAALTSTSEEEDPRVLIEQELAREEAARKADADRVAAAIAAARAEKIPTDLDQEGPGFGTYAAAALGLALLVGGGVLFMRRRSSGPSTHSSNEDDVLGDGNPFAGLADTEVATPVTPETFGAPEENEASSSGLDGELAFGSAETAGSTAPASVSSLLGASNEAPAQDDLFQSVAADLASRQDDEEQNADDEVQVPLATAESAGEDDMDSFTELTPIGSSDSMPSPMMGGEMGAATAQIERLVQELESRVAKLETRLEESLDARERLERQVSAQTEELRVQRAAIARTQRAVRNISQAPVDDSATEPALKQP